MTWEDIEAMTNDGGRKFLGWVKNDCDPIGTTERGSRHGEFFVIYQYRDEKYCRYKVLVLSKSTEQHNGACFYGGVSHYSKELQRSAAVARGEGYPGRYCPKTCREIEEWLMKDFGIPKWAFYFK